MPYDRRRVRSSSPSSIEEAGGCLEHPDGLPPRIVRLGILVHEAFARGSPTARRAAACWSTGDVHVTVREGLVVELPVRIDLGRMVLASPWIQWRTCGSAEKPNLFRGVAC